MRRQKVAIKEMRTNDKLNQDGTLLMEIEFMRQCNHENIVNFIDSYLVSSSLWVVMEFVDGCNLCDLTGIFPTMKESVIARIARDVRRVTPSTRVSSFVPAQLTGGLSWTCRV